MLSVITMRLKPFELLLLAVLAYFLLSPTIEGYGTPHIRGFHPVTHGTNKRYNADYGCNPAGYKEEQGCGPDTGSCLDGDWCYTPPREWADPVPLKDIYKVPDGTKDVCYC